MNSAGDGMIGGIGMLDQLAAQGVLQRSSQGDLLLANPGTIHFSQAGYGHYDYLDKVGDTWSASGWALDPKTSQSCLFAFVVQDGKVGGDLVFRRARRPDVNDHFKLDDLQISGFTVSFRPRPGSAQVGLVAVLPDGKLVLLPGPDKESAEQSTTVLNEVTELDAEWRAMCAKPLYAFPQDSPFHGIYSFDAHFNPKQAAGVTDQFLADAAVYHGKYTDHSHWTKMLLRTFARTSIEAEREKQLSVLEIGCGSGNTAIPLLNLLPQSRIVASDISPQLLAILREQVCGADRDRLLLMAMNASEHNFQEEVFDLVLGTAILHHIIDPSATIGACYHSLKKGGYAIFFEPFEAGHLLVRLLYEQLLERRKELNISDEVAEVLRLVIIDCDVRKGSDKSADICALLDDKWLFTRAYFEQERAKYGYSGLGIYPMYHSEGRFGLELKSHVKLHLGLGPEAVSPEAFEYIRRFESKISPEVYGELLIEGCVILTK
jgi:SAM-dependent methyltransferase